MLLAESNASLVLKGAAQRLQVKGQDFNELPLFRRQNRESLQ
jgi:hypothetical protein